MNIRRTFSIVCIVLSSVCIVLAGNTTHKQQQKSQRDSLFLIPHEEYFESLINRSLRSKKITPVPSLRSATTVPFPNVDISNDASPQNEPSVRISHKDPNNAVAAWRDFRTGVNPAIRRVGFSFTTDRGATWSASQLLPLLHSDIGYVRNSDPAVCVDTSGNFYIATIALDNTNSNGKIMVYKSFEDSYIFPYAFFAPIDTENSIADKEYIVCDLSPTSPFSDNLYISWHYPNTGQVMLTRSTDEGFTWSHSVHVSDPGNFGFGPDLCVRANGDVCVVWSSSAGVMFDKSTDGGLSFGIDKLVDSTLFFGNVPGEIGGWFAIATDLSQGQLRGNLYTVWTDGRYGDFDIFCSSSSDGGDHWSKAKRVNDDPVGNGKLQFWPWIAVDDRGVVTIIYNDTRNTPDSSFSIFETYLAYSWDGGRTFTNALLSTQQSPRNKPNGQVRFGDYIGIDSWGKHTIPVWTDERAGGFDMDIYTAVLDTLPNMNLAVLQFPVQNAWNMVSSPITNVDQLVLNLFPTSTPPAYSFNGDYIPKDAMEPGTGYWLRFNSGGTVQVAGDSIQELDVAVQDGWNVIGSISSPILASTITSVPPEMITSSFFTYTGFYTHSDSILPGSAYWVKVNGSGTLTLSSTGALVSTNRIRIIHTDELPPSAPGDQLSVLSETPSSFALGQNYPNPFNPMTTLSFAIPRATFVTLKVYDILGKEVATLVNGLLETGKYSQTWNAADLASGIYTYRLIAGDYAETRKMLFLK